MNEDSTLRPRHRAGVERAAQVVPYTVKDFQLEVLDRLEEVQNLAVSLDESWTKKVEAIKDQRFLKFDSRTLIAMAAIVLSITGYVIQESRNVARQDSEIEAMRARVLRLEQVATTNTESRIRTEVELGDLRDGQQEIKTLIEAHDSSSKKVSGTK